MDRVRDRSHSQLPESILERLLSDLRARKILKYLKRNMVLCDVGCGYHGYLLEKLCQYFQLGIGIDASVAKDRRSEKYALLEADLNRNIPLKDNTVDIVTSLAVLEHLSQPILHLREVYRILKTGGLLLLTTPTPSAKPVLEFLAFRMGVISKSEILDHKMYYSKRTLETSLETGGFKKEDMAHSYFQVGLNQLIISKK